MVYLTSTGVAASTANLFISTSNNVGIGTTSPGYKLEVSGYIGAPLVSKVQTIDLTNTSTFLTTRFYPIVINVANSLQTSLYRHEFSVDMPSQGGGVAYNDHWIRGWVQAGGWSDQQPRMFQLAHGYYDTNERSILGVYVGAQDALTEVVVYLRGGGTYYVTTASSTVTAYSSAYINANNTFAIKNVAGVDVVGTSVGANQLFFGITSSTGTYTSGVNVVQNVNSTYGTPATTGSFASDAGVLDRINGGDIVLDTGMTASGPVWLQARRLSNFADKFDLLLNPNGGNVGIGVSPACQLHLYNTTSGGQIGIGMQNDSTSYMRMGMDSSYLQYICNNAFWNGSAYNYVYTGGYGGQATRIQQYNGTIGFDTASGGTNPISFTNRLYIANGGNVGIGTTTPTSYTLQVSGSIGATADITAFTSDERLKSKTGPITDALDKVCTLDTFTYTHNDLARSFGFTDKRQYVGISAQQVRKVQPEVVRIAPFDADGEGSKSGEDYLTVQYDRLVPLLIEALKEERKAREALEERLERLDKLLEQK